MAFLTEKERHTLALLCDTLLPQLEVEAGDDERLFSLCAADLNISQLFEDAFERVTTEKDQQDFKLLLKLLENGLVNGLIGGQWGPFSTLPLEAREQLLYKLATHRIERARVAFLSVKRLAAFLFYAMMPEYGHNPTWPVLGYQIPGQQIPKPKPITPFEVNGSGTLSTDVLVIGSGAGGGVVAGELAAAGYDVMIVEKGGYFSESDFDGSEITSTEHMYEKYGALVTEDTSMSILAGSMLGGGTTINWMTSLRPPEHVLRQWQHDYAFTGATSHEYQQSLEAVTRRVNINTDESITNPNNALLEKGCQALGYAVTVIPRNVKGCEECSFCNYGCAFGAKQGTMKTYLQDAYDAGARILVNAHVDRITSRSGIVTGAMLTVQDANGAAHVVTVRAKVVVVCAGAIHTPALLIRSGLRNANIGANLHLHPTTVTSGVFEEEVLPWRGVPQSRCSFEFADLDGKGYGVWLETAPAHPGLNSLATTWTSARQHRHSIQDMTHTANIIILARDRDAGRIKVDSAGQPVVAYRLSKYDARHLLLGVKQALRIHVAAGAKEVATGQHTRPVFYPERDDDLGSFLNRVGARGLRPNDFALFSAHQMSSCRIGGDSARGALDPTGQSYEVKNLFVADGSVLPTAPGVNPMLTIMTTAHYIAQHIKTVV